MINVKRSIVTEICRWGAENQSNTVSLILRIDSLPFVGRLSESPADARRGAGGRVWVIVSLLLLVTRGNGGTLLRRASICPLNDKRKVVVSFARETNLIDFADALLVNADSKYHQNDSHKRNGVDSSSYVPSCSSSSIWDSDWIWRNNTIYEKCSPSVKNEQSTSRDLLIFLNNRIQIDIITNIVFVDFKIGFMF
jgi:hypothetical protein